MRLKLVAAALAAAALIGVVSAAALDPQQIVEQRVDDMKKMGGALKAATLAATPAEAHARVAEALAYAQAIPSKFPAGTGPGDAGVKRTRSVPEIWTKSGEFHAAADTFVAALKAFDAALGTGDKAAGDAALDGVRKACKSCHDTFRGPE